MQRGIKRKASSQGSLKDNLLKFPVLKIVNNKQEQFDSALTRYVTNSMRPFSTVEDPSFNEMIATLNPAIKVMSRGTLMKRIESSAHESRIEAREIFSRATNVSTCADVWATKNDSYLGVVATSLDDKYHRSTRLLACKPFPNPHTGERIAFHLSSIHREFSLSEEKLVGTTTDSASNNIKAFADFGLPLIDDDEDECEYQSDDNTESSEEIVDSVLVCSDDANQSTTEVWLPKHFKFVIFIS